MSRTGWLEVDLSGLEQLLSRRSKEFIILELINARRRVPPTVGRWQYALAGGRR